MGEDSNLLLIDFEFLFGFLDGVRQKRENPPARKRKSTVSKINFSIDEQWQNPIRFFSHVQSLSLFSDEPF
jgi:hypothetical protein